MFNIHPIWSLSSLYMSWICPKGKNKLMPHYNTFGSARVETTSCLSIKLSALPKGETTSCLSMKFLALPKGK
jgi:hypothetical protein